VFSPSQFTGQGKLKREIGGGGQKKNDASSSYPILDLERGEGHSASLHLGEGGRKDNEIYLLSARVEKLKGTRKDTRRHFPQPVVSKPRVWGRKTFSLRLEGKAKKESSRGGEREKKKRD